MTDPTFRPPARTGPLPFFVLVDEAMRRVRQNFRTIYPSIAIPLALLSTVSAVLQVLWMQRLFKESGGEVPNPLSMWSFETLGVGLLLGLGIVVGINALQKAAVDATAGRPVDLRQAWRFAVRPAVLGTLVLQFLLILGSMVFCLVPVLYVAPLLSFVMPVMAEEGTFLGQALSRSAELTRYNPQKQFLDMPLVKSLALMLIVVLLSYATAFLVGLVFQLPMLIDIFRKASAGAEPGLEAMTKWAWLQIPSQLIQVLLNVVLYMYSAFGFALLYFDTRNRKEGADLAAEIDTVFGPGAPAGEPAP